MVYRTGSKISRLMLVDFQGRSRQLGTIEDAFNNPRFSPDGSRIAVGIGGTNASDGQSGVQDLWLVDRDSGEATRLTRTGNASMPEWTPDGNCLVYIARSPSKHREIWALSLDGSGEPRRLIEIDSDPAHAVPTPDGRSLIVALDLADNRNYELVQVALDGRPTTGLAGPSIIGSVRRPDLPRVSPDGSNIAFFDWTEWEVYVRPIVGAGALQVTDAGGFSPAWGPDGRQLFFADGNFLQVAELRYSQPGRRRTPDRSHTSSCNQGVRPVSGWKDFCRRRFGRQRI